MNRGRGAVYWSADEAHGPSPLELVCRAAHCFPALFSPALAKIDRLDETIITDLLARMPEQWMSRSAKQFASALMRYSVARLQEVLR